MFTRASSHEVRSAVINLSSQSRCRKRFTVEAAQGPIVRRDGDSAQGNAFMYAALKVLMSAKSRLGFRLEPSTGGKCRVSSRGLDRLRLPSAGGLIHFAPTPQRAGLEKTSHQSFPQTERLTSLTLHVL